MGNYRLLARDGHGLDPAFHAAGVRSYRFVL
jgi:hypothetical protein